ncbi:phosphotransferase [Brevibacillus fluminis]|uniref:phosphotransferase n=1 Tax=Brevibacillus fluminis TaxID=511487 RepID=UPI003F8A3B02
MNAQQKMVVRLARHFQLKVAASEQVKAGVYRVTAQNGKTYCIKRLKYEADEVIWIDRLLRKLKRKGYSNICWRDPDEAHHKLIHMKSAGAKEHYVITPWIDGQMPDPRDHEDMRTCARELAAFHQAARGISLAACAAREWLGKWPEQFLLYRQMITKYVKKAERGRLSEGLADFFQEHGKNIVHDADVAIEMLAKSRYADLCQQAKEVKTYCHADCGPKNMVISKTGPILIDFETIRMDLRIYDIYRLIRLANKSNDWDFSIAQTILEGYESVERIAKEEYALLAAWLLFPHKTYRILRKYNTRTDEGKRELEQSLQQEQRARANVTGFLQKLHAYMKRGG